MRLVSFFQDGQVRVGAVRGGAVHPLRGVGSMAEVIAIWSRGGQLSDLEVEAGGLPLADLVLDAPIRPMRNLFCIGWNYRDHFEEGKAARGPGGPEEAPPFPTLFSKASACVVGPASDIALHSAVTEKLDWEAELAVVIGRGGRDIAEADALDHVFGYLAANDVSARDLQQRHGGQWFKGKSLDATCPLGPWIVTADEIADPQALDIACRVNGVTKQQANTRQQVFGVARLIALLSEGMTLLPGDVLLTGTPEGVGNARTPPEYLCDGDVVEIEIQGIGILRNRVAQTVVAAEAVA